jgi:AcrR family transcriptional regulator
MPMKDAATTKHKIQAAGLKLFVQKGVSETTTRDLARDAGIAEGTLYRHYLSKDELVADLFATHYAAYAGRLEMLEQRETGFGAKLRAMIADVCRLYDSDPTLFRFLLLTQHQAMPRLPADFSGPVDVVHRVVAAAIAAGELPPGDAELATAMVLGLVLQPAAAIVYGRLAPPMMRYADAVIAACERALGVA